MFRFYAPQMWQLIDKERFGPAFGAALGQRARKGAKDETAAPDDQGEAWGAETAPIPLPPDAAQHARAVRLRTGDRFSLFDGEGNEVLCELSFARRRDAEFAPLRRIEARTESPLRCVVVQAVCADDKMDWALQKGTELGAAAFAPFLAQRGALKLDAARLAKKRERYAKIVASACEQCGRSRLPPVAEPLPMERALAQLGQLERQAERLGLGAGRADEPGLKAKAGMEAREKTATEEEDGERNEGTGREGGETKPLRLMLDPRAAHRLDDLPSRARLCSILIGPEGGFEREETALAVERFGFTALRLGPRVLRTETAAMALLACLQMRWGDLSEPAAD